MTEPLNAPPRQSVGDLLGDVTRDLSTLIRQEVELAKAEVTQSAKQAAKGGSMFAGAAVAGHFVLLFLSVALWWALGDAMDSLPWSAVIVAVLWAVVAAVLASRGRAEAKRVGGMPRTTDTVKKIPNALQGHEEKNS
ncbi:phage holin family protein [Cellulomonas sp. URHE0023]|uniref:phage holin family protein n=1 Tax=Cellulomonas sp. URHE0023 TaxID=1380354 RepID=UPI000553AF7B|nr:phage holin family protein [Cellulomonas sp. URHE0023]